jgi:hypothetical protein
MYYDTVLGFVSRDCKSNNHVNCTGCWYGFGFRIICSCKDCHGNTETKTLARVWDPAANVIVESSLSSERAEENGIQQI